MVGVFQLGMLFFYVKHIAENVAIVRVTFAAEKIISSCRREC